MISPLIRRYAAAAIFFGSLVAWPATMLTVWKGEPPGILSLSWAAIALTAADIFATTDVRVQEEDE